MTAKVYDFRTGRRLADPGQETFQSAKAPVMSGSLARKPREAAYPSGQRLGERSSRELIRHAANTIVSVATISEILARHELLPDEVSTEAMYDEVNCVLDSLDPQDQEIAWRQAEMVLGASTM